MSESKKYYWLKLKSDFFDDDTIKFIEEQENGIKYRKDVYIRRR